MSASDLETAISTEAAASGVDITGLSVSSISAGTQAPSPSPTTPAPSPAPSPSPTPAPTTMLCSWAPTYDDHICQDMGGVCYSSEHACQGASALGYGNGTFLADGCGDSGCGCCIDTPTTPSSYFKLSLADGSNNYTTEAGGIAELRARLVGKPKNYTTGMAPCLFAIAISDPTEAAVLYPSVLVMTPENAAAEHPVRVVGLWDKTADGDVDFHVVVTALSSTRYDDSGCADVFGYESGETVVTQRLDEPRHRLGRLGRRAHGEVSLGFAPLSALATTEAGGSVDLVANLSRAPIGGASASRTPVSLSEGAAATVSPAVVVFDRYNWKSGAHVVVTGRPEEKSCVVTAGGDCENEYNGYDAIGHRDDDALGMAVGANFTVSLTLLSADDPHFKNPLHTVTGASITITNERVLHWNATRLTKRALPPLAPLNVSLASGSSAYTTEGGGVMELLVQWGASGTIPPPGYPVTFSARTSDPSEAVILKPSTLTFDAVNYATPQRVYVEGIADELDDGDQAYDIVFEFLASEFATPPGVGHLRYDAAIYSATNMDSVLNRVNVVIAGDGCDALVQTNESACSLRFALCYSDAGAECGTPLAYEDLFAMGVADVYVELSLARHFSYSPLDAAHTLAALELRPNSTNDPNAYGAYVATVTPLQPARRAAGRRLLRHDARGADELRRRRARALRRRQRRLHVARRVRLARHARRARRRGRQRRTGADGRGRRVHVHDLRHALPDRRLHPQDQVLHRERAARDGRRRQGGGFADVRADEQAQRLARRGVHRGRRPQGLRVLRDEGGGRHDLLHHHREAHRAADLSRQLHGEHRRLDRLLQLGRSVRGRVRGGRRHVASRRTDRGDRRHERLSGDLHDRARGVG